MLYFNNDYNEICHPEILKALQSSQGSQMPGYGDDPVCEEAASRIRQACNNKDLDVHFLVGGTQSNLTVISAALRPHQAVIAADTGHINVHETGAIEATGHKVITAPSKDGKLRLEQVIALYKAQAESSEAEHIAQPKMVYISNPTEYGTTYTIAELEALSDFCHKNRLFLYLDGARLGYALAACDNDISLADYARLCDVFYIGGTKVGAMMGEAVVINNPAIAEDFRYLIKQKGALLAKGWLLGIQFKTLFTDDLYCKIAGHANRLADKLRSTIEKIGLELYLCNTTNQVFVKLPDAVLKHLEGKFTYAVWEKTDDSHTVVRFCTSWSTEEKNLDALCFALAEAVK